MKTKTRHGETNGVNAFLAQHPDDVTGVISGFDRVRLRASLRYLYQPSFMKRHLCEAGVLLKDFGHYATALSQRVRAAAHAFATRHRRPVRYLYSSAGRKEELAQELVRRDHVEQGLVGVFDCVEPCLTYFVRGDRKAHQLSLHLLSGRCLHHYFYFQHAEFGLMHLRLQTWFPFQVTVCLNGRLWLARQLDRAGIDYWQRDNCFTWIENVPAAQALARAQVRTRWAQQLHTLLAQCHPLAAEICRPLGLSYYWSIDQSEYATDLMFKTPEALSAIYPTLVHHGIQNFGTPEVLRFLGRTVPGHGHVHRLYKGDVESELKHRPEGLRLKHYVNGNSLKIYDKQGQVLRVETTMNYPEGFRVYRRTEGKPRNRKRWLPLRKSVVDMPRRAQVCAAANGRYLEALATIPTSTPAGKIIQPVCQAVIRNGRRHRALNPWAQPDATLLATIARGEWTLNGFRNRDVRAKLFPDASDKVAQRRQAGRITRAFALLRAHGLIHKVTGTHRYIVTTKGRQIITAVLAAQQASVDRLIQLAA